MGIQSLAEPRRNNDAHFLRGSTVRPPPSSGLQFYATVVERPEGSANRAAVELKRQVEDRRLNSITCKTIDKIQELLGASGGNLVYAGYPYDPFAPDAGKR
jgi:hypothetical protein